MNSSDLREFVAGFVDGDGCIGIERPNTKVPRPIPGVSIGQSHLNGYPPELEFVRKHFGGSISLSVPGTETKRPAWKLRIRKKSEVPEILGAIASHGVVKGPQAVVALDYLSNGRNDPQITRDKLDALKTMGAYANVEIHRNKITVPYLAGLFAAEGSVFMAQASDGNYTLRTCIAQSSCIPLLEAIREKLGSGCVGSGVLQLSCAQAIPFLQAIQPYLKDSQKKRQVHLALKFHANKTTTQGRRRTEAEQKKLKKIAKKIRKLKRL